MNELFFNWRKSLNLKKVIVAILLIVTFILLIVFWVLHKKDDTILETSPLPPSSISNPEKNTTTFFNNNQSVSVELSNTYNLKQYTPSNNHIIELRTDNNLNIFISEKDLINGRNLKDVALADRLAYTESFESISNLSEIKELIINNSPAYTYSFHYLDTDLNETFYIQITWLETNGKYFIFDIEFPLNDLDSHTNTITETLSSFKLL